MSIESVVLTPLQVVGRIPDLIRSTRSSSLVDYTKSTRSEPITLISRELVSYHAMGDIAQSAVSMYSGFYLQSIAIAANVGRVDVIRTLDKVNPNRDPIEAGGLWIESGLSNESYQLPGLESVRKSKPSLESFRDEENSAASTNFDRNSIDTISASTSLAAGKVFNVEITDQGQTATIPVSVRLFVTPIEQEVMLNILTHASKDNRVKERFYGIKSGRLKLISDGVFAMDLIREHRKTLMKDRSNQYQAILKRANKNRLSGLLSLNPSVATASNIAMISQTDARQLEGMIGGKLKDFKVRKRIFDNTYLMLMFVVDTDFDMVTVYFNGIESSTQLSVRDVKNVNKNGNMDVAEITRLLTLGQAPRY